MGQVYDDNFKEQIIKECEDVGNVTVVARKYEIPTTTIHTWIARRQKNTPQKRAVEKKISKIKSLESENAAQKKEISILKELLKKTHQLWLKD